MSMRTGFLAATVLVALRVRAGIAIQFGKAG